ncbi:WD40 repeat-like protein [Basidiobolus meristosporus CBS 931.73]|uniref:WD40 repeat-like protein n=1 Tax=Basidiobolus meristosporus CBS 931.73 TaxID=1314790 RepID=A0A1Y1ZAM0_9FUNG|nr:WD40 repeat-like protein [Basidiobolus meristosporus CBS 931.73]|eukprot:ORY07226.1 WD40 repeat-like protein [Basidiobolus meristosporus CBS 931.73]
MPELPGFYYDPERKRYFKILPNRSAPVSHPYRQDNLVQKQKQKEVEERNKLECETANRQTVRTSHRSYLREREITSNKDSISLRSNAEKFFCRSLQCQATLEIPNGIEISDIQILPHRTQLLCGQMDGHVRLLNYQHNTGDFVDQEWHSYTKHPTQITSISIGGDELVVCTSFNHWSLGRILGDRVTTVHSSHMENTTIWTSTAHGVRNIALGTSEGLFMMDPNRENIHVRRIRTHSDVFTIAVEPNEDNIYYSGCRNGKISLLDLRGRPENALGYRHRSAVCQLSRVGDWGLVSGGMDGAALLWDLRKQSEPLLHSIASKHPPRKKRKQETQVTPILDYHGHVNEHVRKLGFSINSQGSQLVIAGQDRMLRFWDVYSGQTLRQPIGQFEGEITATRWCQENDMQTIRKMESLPDFQINLANAKDLLAPRRGLWVAAGKTLHWYEMA